MAISTMASGAWAHSSDSDKRIPPPVEDRPGIADGIAIDGSRYDLNALIADPENGMRKLCDAVKSQLDAIGQSFQRAAQDVSQALSNMSGNILAIHLLSSSVQGEPQTTDFGDVFSGLGHDFETTRRQFAGALRQFPPGFNVDDLRAVENLLSAVCRELLDQARESQKSAALSAERSTRIDEFLSSLESEATRDLANHEKSLKFVCSQQVKTAFRDALDLNAAADASPVREDVISVYRAKLEAMLGPKSLIVDGAHFLLNKLDDFCRIFSPPANRETANLAEGPSAAEAICPDCSGRFELDPYCTVVEMKLNESGYGRISFKNTLADCEASFDLTPAENQAESAAHRLGVLSHIKKTLQANSRTMSDSVMEELHRELRDLGRGYGIKLETKTSAAPPPGMENPPAGIEVVGPSTLAVMKGQPAFTYTRKSCEAADWSDLIVQRGDRGRTSLILTTRGVAQHAESLPLKKIDGRVVLEVELNRGLENWRRDNFGTQLLASFAGELIDSQKKMCQGSSPLAQKLLQAGEIVRLENTALLVDDLQGQKLTAARGARIKNVLMFVDSRALELDAKEASVVAHVRIGTRGAPTFSSSIKLGDKDTLALSHLSVDPNVKVTGYINAKELHAVSIAGENALRISCANVRDCRIVQPGDFRTEALRLLSAGRVREAVRAYFRTGEARVYTPDQDPLNRR